MYVGNGVTKEFPLPDGGGGTFAWVAWVSPEGSAVWMKEGDTYTARDGAVFFSAPPPEGWKIAFGTEAAEALIEQAGQQKSICTVIYPDGSVKELDRDPWELLAQAAAERETIQKLLADVREKREEALAELRALADEARESLKSRLLGYGERAENAIAAAVRAAQEDTASALSRDLREIREFHKEAKAEAARTRSEQERIASEVKTEMARARLEVRSFVSGAELAADSAGSFAGESRGFRDEAQAAAFFAAKDAEQRLENRIDAWTRTTLEELRNIRLLAESECKSLTERAGRETQDYLIKLAGLHRQTAEALTGAQAAAERCEEMAQEMEARERGLRALWDRVHEAGKELYERTNNIEAQGGGARSALRVLTAPPETPAGVYEDN